jgi:heme/copper-type cytochrome/quinol oxidase subunit 1
VAHFHYVLSLGAIFAIMGGVSFWFPIIFGVTLNYKLINLQFFLLFLGANITFFPQHFLGLRGMPRRYSDYSRFQATWNIVSSIGSIISFLRLFLLSWIIFESFITQRHLLRAIVISSNIEWMLLNPPKNHVFTQRIQVTR